MNSLDERRVARFVSSILESRSYGNSIRNYGDYIVMEYVLGNKEGCNVIIIIE